MNNYEKAVIATVLALLVIIGVFAGIAGHQANLAEYWRKQYDLEKSRQPLAGQFQLPAVISLTKTCIDKYGSETIGWDHAELVFTATSQQEGRLMMKRCPQGTVDAEVYIGRK